MEISGAEDRKNLMFGEPVVVGDVADGACAGKANAGGGRELHGREYKVRPSGER